MERTPWNELSYRARTQEAGVVSHRYTAALAPTHSRIHARSRIGPLGPPLLLHLREYSYRLFLRLRKVRPKEQTNGHQTSRFAAIRQGIGRLVYRRGSD